jgi:iron complex transport system ATP-binding protein
VRWEAVSSEALLTARGVGWQAAGRSILAGIDEAVRVGECLVVVGPNGAGKTTLLRLLVGLLEPSSGSLVWGETPYSELSRRELAQRIAYVPQNHPLRIPLTVEQMVLLGRYPYLSALRIAPQERDFVAVARALELAGIEGLRRRPLIELSGGERQSVYIASALAQEAELMILDEPTTHLDPLHQREISDLLARLNRQNRLSVVVATHDLNFASVLADRILALRDGSVVACETPERLLTADRLSEVFGAPFSVVRSGPRPRTLLEWEP